MNMAGKQGCKSRTRPYQTGSTNAKAKVWEEPEKNKNVQVPETNLLPVLHISCLYLRCWFIARQNYIGVIV